MEPPQEWTICLESAESAEVELRAKAHGLTPQEYLEMQICVALDEMCNACCPIAHIDGLKRRYDA